MSFKQIRKLGTEFRKYVLFIILPLLLGLFLYWGVSITISSIQTKYGNLSVDDVKSKVSSVLSEIELLSQSMQHNSTFMDYALADSDTVLSKPEVCQLLNLYSDDCANISNIYLFQEEQSMIYTSGGYYDYRSIDYIFSSLGITVSPGAKLADLGLTDGWHCNNNGVFSPYYSVYLKDSDESVISLLVLVMDRSYLYRLMQANGSLLCCIFNEECSIYSLFSVPFDVDWNDSSQVTALLGQPIKCFYIEDDQYTYLVALPSSEYNLPLYGILVLFSLYFLIMLIVNVYQALRLSNQRYTAISSLINALPSSVQEQVSEESLPDVIAKSMQNYKHEHDSVLINKKAETLHLILFGYLSDSVSDLKYERAGILTNAEAYCIVTFYVEDYSIMNLIIPNEENEDTELDSLVQAMLRSTMERYTTGRYVISGTSMLHNFSAVLSLPEKPPDCTPIIEIVHKTLQTVENAYGLNIVACISEMSGSRQEIPTLFQQTRSLYHFSRVIGTKSNIIAQDDFASDMELLLNDDFLQQISMLINALVSERYEIIPQTVHTILKDNITSGRSSYANAVERLSCISNILQEAVQRSNLDPDQINHLKTGFSQANSATELYDRTFEFCQLAETQVKSDSITDPVQVACAFICEHYSDPNLSVPAICEAVGISVQHLSRLFRQNLDITITEYLNNQRVEHAKKLLIESKYTAASIAEQVGYNSSITFNRNFKKIVGMTPSTFRSLHSIGG
ncbi:MAG: AraC family transcriptional regulator [Clostridiales bacterium]|nr:AraC family transcriptional regulator [Clostridiales bacterium]